MNTLLSLAKQYSYINPDSCILFANEAKKIAEKVSDRKKTAIALTELGWGNNIKGNYPEALKNYFDALKIRNVLNKRELASTLGNIGIVYLFQAEYPKALDYFLRTLKTYEELNDRHGIAAILTNIGNVYYEQSDYPKTLNYYFRTLKMVEEFGDKEQIALCLGNIGSVYQAQTDLLSEISAKENNNLKALDYSLKALKINEELGNKVGIATNLSAIGNVYSVQADFSSKSSAKETYNNKALDYYFRALKMSEDIGDKKGIVTCLHNISSIYAEASRFGEAEEYLKRSIIEANNIGSLSDLKAAYQNLFHLYETTGRDKLALDYYKKYITARDSIFSEENQKKLIRSEMNYEFEKKHTEQQAGHEKQLLQKETEKKQQRLYLILAGAIAAAIAVVALIVFRSLRITRKQKRIIELQKTNVEEAKQIIEEKNKETLDSIRYARRIQQSLLPSEKYMERNLRRLN
jgi:tetratricopeptide (TPR) repeat protein